MKESFFISSSGIVFEYRNDVPSNSGSLNATDEFEIVYVCDGVGKYFVDNKEYDLRPRTLFFSSARELHGLVQDVPSSVERYTLRFSRGVVDDFLSEVVLDRFASGADRCLFCTASVISLSILSVFERFEVSEIISEPARAIYLKSLLSEILVLISASESKPISNKEAELGAEVLRYLDGNINKNISLDKLSKRFFVSKYYLCRAFKRHSGMSVHSYINQKRIMHAKELIESGETASRAAYNVGFGDYSAFYRAYVRIVGKSPGAKDGE